MLCPFCSFLIFSSICYSTSHCIWLRCIEIYRESIILNHSCKIATWVFIVKRPQRVWLIVERRQTVSRRDRNCILHNICTWIRLVVFGCGHTINSKRIHVIPYCYDDIIKWNHFYRVTGPLRGESTGDRWIPLTKASDAELWCFVWPAPE